MEMPVMDGFETGRKIKANNKAHGAPLIATSAIDSVDMQSRALEAGFGIFKPKYDLQALADTIAGLCGQNEGPI